MIKFLKIVLLSMAIVCSCVSYALASTTEFNKRIEVYYDMIVDIPEKDFFITREVNAVDDVSELNLIFKNATQNKVRFSYMVGDVSIDKEGKEEVFLGDTYYIDIEPLETKTCITALNNVSDFKLVMKSESIKFQEQPTQEKEEDCSLLEILIYWLVLLLGGFCIFVKLEEW